MKIPFPTTGPSSLSRLAAAITLILSPFHLEAESAPDIMKARSYNAEIFSETVATQDTVSAFFVSEKLDGIRAFWTGKQLVTRSGTIIHAPAWFSASLPSHIPLDGELWAGRDSFQQVTTTVLDKAPNDAQWKQIKFMVFDLPASSERFEQRLKQLTSVITDIDQPHIQAIPHFSYQSQTALNSKLEQVTQAKGEGLMLHHKDNLYHQGRSDKLLKMKHHQDAEAVVIGYEEGNGKHSGKMGAIWVLAADNIKFKIGSGFKDEEREHPPQLGSIIQYRYNGYTSTGIPRFARYLRARPTPEL